MPRSNVHMEFFLGTQKYSLEFQYGIKEHPVRIQQVVYIGDDVLDSMRDTIGLACRFTGVSLVKHVDSFEQPKQTVAYAEDICVPTDLFTKEAGRYTALEKLTSALIEAGWDDKSLNHMAGAYMNRKKKFTKKQLRARNSSKPISVDVLLEAGGEVEHVLVNRHVQA